METTINEKAQALAKFLGCDVNDISESTYDDATFEAEGGEYLVLDDQEADDRVSESIKESLWAFNADFIASHTANGLSDEAIKSLRETQGKLCESANSLVLALIDDLDHFINDAVISDGRGHFLSSYDGEENEEGKFYIYRVN